MVRHWIPLAGLVGSCLIEDGDVGEVDGRPAGHERAQAEVHVLHRRAAVPAACRADGLAAPHACRTGSEKLLRLSRVTPGTPDAS